jgi:hypothetical protein
VIFYLVCVAWIGVSVIGALGFGKTIRLRDQGGPR